ncbi:MAG TPA: methylmalonyl-CoA mutase family protein [Bryobacteraceae bacterium]|nr:methylmalonyl-CoA mutase family protein [Bryobacteraceae bacterium]
MPEEILHLAQDFPPVPTAAWEAAIQKDLKGADYEKKLVWRSEEGIAVRPYYRREDLAGQFPCVRDGQPWEARGDAAFTPDAVRADRLHDAGAHAVQELGYALAEGVERLASGQQVEFVYAAGSNYFFEIAKLRAARLLWAQAAAAFGIDCAVRIHVRTSRLNKSLYDRYTNLLRATTEAMSAVIGGADTLYVEPFGFPPRLAGNVQNVLREEAHLDAVADPASGSYYIETLTDALAAQAWKLFQSVEREGGYSQALASGSIEKALEETRAARRKTISSRRRTLVGVNNFPNAGEKTPEAEAPSSEFDRLAEPFEAIRRRTAAHAKRTGRYPKVLLLKRGDLKMRMARANFCFNFLGCAGFDVVESEEYAATDADLIVLCSSDPEYLSFAKEVCAAVSVPVLVAGNPKDQIGALKAAGVQGFLHISSDAVETLTEWQTRLGIEA